MGKTFGWDNCTFSYTKKVMMQIYIKNLKYLYLMKYFFRMMKINYFCERIEFFLRTSK